MSAHRRDRVCDMSFGTDGRGLGVCVILRQDGIDDPGERVELRTYWRPAPSVSGRHRKCQHLRHCPRVNPITTRRFPPTYALNLNRITNLSIELHALYP